MFKRLATDLILIILSPLLTPVDLYTHSLRLSVDPSPTSRSRRRRRRRQLSNKHYSHSDRQENRKTRKVLGLEIKQVESTETQIGIKQGDERQTEMRKER